MKSTGLALVGTSMAACLGGLLISSFAFGANEATVAIVSGTYGNNCGAPHGNATRDLARHCNGLRTCNYSLPVVAAHSRGCRSNYLAEWRCGSNEFHNASLSAGASAGDRLVLSCVPSNGPGH
jgi:hypothetical protein